MTKLRAGLLIAAGIFLLVLGVAATGFYFKVYKPIAAPIMAMSFGTLLEQKQLTTHDFTKPVSGELSADQVRRFVAIEQETETRVAGGRAVLAEQQGVLERADVAGQLTLKTALASFGAMRPILMGAKPAQIEAMNREHFSKAEFEWVRDQLYRAAGIHLTRIDVSEVLSGFQDATVRVRVVSQQDAPAANQALARPMADKLEAWRAFAFFGL